MCLWKLNGWIEYLSCRRASTGLSVKLLAIVAVWSLKLNCERGNQSDFVWLRWQCPCRAFSGSDVVVYANVFLKVGIRSRAAHDHDISDRASVLHVKGEQMAFLCILLVCIYSCIAYCHLFNLHFIHSSGPMVLSSTLFPDQRKNDNEPFFKLESIHWIEKLQWQNSILHNL